MRNYQLMSTYDAPLQVRLRDVRHAPVGLCEETQLLERVVPRGLEGIEHEPDLRRARAPR